MAAMFLALDGVGLQYGQRGAKVAAVRGVSLGLGPGRWPWLSAAKTALAAMWLPMARRPGGQRFISGSLHR